MGWERYLRRREWDRERASEIETHIELEIDDNLGRGMSAQAAAEAARRKFGNPLLMREEIYRMNSIGWLDSLWQDLRFGARLLRSQPGFTLTAVASLALGIGANASMFQLLDAVRLRSLPVEHPETLARIYLGENDSRSGNFSTRSPDLTLPQWDLLRTQQQAFSGLAAFADTRFNLALGGEVQYVDGLYVNGDYFRTLGVAPVLGRSWNVGEDRKGCGSGSAVISFGFWQSRFGGKADAIGKKLLLNGHSSEVIGVAPASFFGLDVGRTFDVALPLCAEPQVNGLPGRIERRQWWLAVFGRLNKGWTFAQATAHLKAISPGIYAATVPEVYRPEDVKKYLALQLEATPGATGVSDLRENMEKPLWILFAMTALVLVIACANLANLMMARGSIRAREIAVRLALGASQARVIRQLLSESLLLALGGALAGALIAAGLSHFLVALITTDEDRYFLTLTPDWNIFALLACVALVTCLLFGLAPALSVAGTSPGAAMKAGSRAATAGRERFGFRRMLVVTQVALSLVLLVGALLFVRSFAHLMTLDAGFRQDGVLVTNVNLRRANYQPEDIAQIRRNLLEGIRALPGVISAAETSLVPLDDGFWNENLRTADQPNKSQLSNFARISNRYFETFGTPLLQGRDFDSRDTLISPKVCIVNEAFAKQIFSGQGPLGKTFELETGPGQPRLQYEVVGLVKDAKYRRVQDKFFPTAYVAMTQETSSFPGGAFLIRSNQQLSSLVSPLNNLITSAHPSLSIQFRVFERQVQESLRQEALMAILSTVFGVLAAVLAVVGLYGIMAYTTNRRRNEIGIRMALGANRRSVIGMVMGEAGWMVGIGLLIGTALALAAGRAAASLLFGIEPHDPLTVTFALALLAVVALAAGFIPAFRASRLNPMTALRDE